MNKMPKFVTAPLADNPIRALTVAWHDFMDTVFNPYRPEHYYMRGPGPKWRAKHGGEGKAPVF